jgi:hypothetical protein
VIDPQMVEVIERLNRRLATLEGQLVVLDRRVVDLVAVVEQQVRERRPLLARPKALEGDTCV